MSLCNDNSDCLAAEWNSVETENNCDLIFSYNNNFHDSQNNTLEPASGVILGTNWRQLPPDAPKSTEMYVNRLASSFGSTGNWGSTTSLSGKVTCGADEAGSGSCRFHYAQEYLSDLMKTYGFSEFNSFDKDKTYYVSTMYKPPWYTDKAYLIGPSLSFSTNKNLATKFKIESGKLKYDNTEVPSTFKFWKNANGEFIIQKNVANAEYPTFLRPTKTGISEFSQIRRPLQFEIGLKFSILETEISKKKSSTWIWILSIGGGVFALVIIALVIIMAKKNKRRKIGIGNSWKS
jgi:hypothetical protein